MVGGVFHMEPFSIDNSLLLQKFYYVSSISLLMPGHYISAKNLSEK